MSLAGSWVRFAVGIVLSAEIIRQLITGENDLMIAGMLSVFYIALGISYFAFKF